MHKLFLKTLAGAFLLLAMLLGGCSGGNTEKNTAAADSTATERSTDERQTMLFFGNSLTAGYGVEPEQAYPAVIQDFIDSLGWPYRCINAGVSGETSAAGLTRIDWMLKRQAVDVFVLELGGNDGLRGIATKEMQENLLGILQKVTAKYPGCSRVLVPMEAPANMGQTYQEAFRKVYLDISRSEQIPLMPNILQDVYGKPDLMQADGIHPTVKGHQVVAQTLWKGLRPVLAKRLKAAKRP